MTLFDDNFWWQFLIFSIFFSTCDLWHLRHWLQYWQLRTWIHDNLCYLTINCDTVLDSIRNSCDVLYFCLLLDLHSNGPTHWNVDCVSFHMFLLFLSLPTSGFDLCLSSDTISTFNRVRYSLVTTYTSLLLLYSDHICLFKSCFKMFLREWDFCTTAPSNIWIHSLLELDTVSTFICSLQSISLHVLCFETDAAYL